MTTIALFALLLTEPSPTLLVRVNGLSSDQGRVRLALYDSKAAWNGEVAPRATVSLPASPPTSEWTVPELPTGEYGVKVFHDLNGDGDLARSERGRPVEPFGFSGATKSLLGRPGWKTARVRVGPGTTVVVIHLRGSGSKPSEAELEAAGRELAAEGE